MHLSALAALVLFTEAIHPYFCVYLPARAAAPPVLPFLPLLLTSCGCAALLLGCWVEAGRLAWAGADK